MVPLAERRPRRLFNRNFFLLWQGQTVSQFGAQGFSIALSLWIKDATGSATIMGLILMLSSLPAVLLGPIAGTIADRFSRRRIILLSDFLNGLFVLSLGLLMWARPAATTPLLIWLCIVSLLVATSRAFFDPAISAALPDLVPQKRLASANSLAQFSYQLALFFGQGLGGTLYRLLGGAALFILNACTYLFSAGSELFITIPQKVPEKIPSWRAQFVVFKEETIIGFRYVWRQRGLRDLVLLSALLNFFTVPIIVLLPFFVEDFLRAPVDWYGFIIAGYGVGTVVGYLFAGALPYTGRSRLVLMIAAMILQPTGYVLLGVTRIPAVALTLAGVGGLANGFVVINVTTLLQLRTPGRMRGRVFGLLGTIAASLSPIAMGLAGVVADLVDQNIPLIYVACGATAAVLAGLIALDPPFRAYLTYAAPATPDSGTTDDETETPDTAAKHVADTAAETMAETMERTP